MNEKETLTSIYADLHLHIGRTERGEPVKISASRELTFRNIAHEAAERKGINLLGVIDAHSPGVQRDIAELLDSGEMKEISGGGIQYKNTTILLGSEIEVRDDAAKGAAHYLIYLPSFEAMQSFTVWMSRNMSNVQLSSQRLYVTGRKLQEEVKMRGGLFIPAHIFTPHKSLLGSSTDQISDVLDPNGIDAVELGLSADTAMAMQLPQLQRYPFLSNSDAHSLRKIGREYNVFRLREPSFAEFKLVLQSREGREICANYGLQPQLGKYHRTFCPVCGELAAVRNAVVERCPDCGNPKLVRGVMERIGQLASTAVNTLNSGESLNRPPYVYQVPLEFASGVGPKMLNKLLHRFGTEMAILHHASPAEIAEIAGAVTAQQIVLAREGKLGLLPGGGGKYGKVEVIR